MHEEEPEQELIAQAQDGAQWAFEKLVHKYQGFIVSFIYRMTQDKDAALDLAQESFVKAYRYIQSFKGQSTFRTWLTSIALNTTRTYLKKRSKEQIDRDSLKEDVDTVTTPEDELNKSQLKVKLRSALNVLKSDQQEVIRLCAIEGFSYSEAAKVLQIPLGTVCSRMNSALSELRVILSKENNHG